MSIMEPEINAAASWLSEQLEDSLGEVTKNKFRDALIASLREKYQGHWYPEDVSRGQGLRAISYEVFPDQVLLNAAFKAQIPDKYLKWFAGCVLWCDPGLVEVLYDGRVLSIFPGSKLRKRRANSLLPVTMSEGKGKVLPVTDSPPLSDEERPAASAKSVSEPSTPQIDPIREFKETKVTSDRNDRTSTVLTRS